MHGEALGKVQLGTYWAHQIGFTLRHISAREDAGAASGFLGNSCAATPRIVRPPQRPTEVIAAPIILVPQWGFFMKFHRAVG